MRWLLVPLTFSSTMVVLQAQDLMSALMGSFLGSGLSGNNELGGETGSGIGGMLTNFATTGNSPGPGSNNPFSSIFSIGKSLFGGRSQPSVPEPFSVGESTMFPLLLTTAAPRPPLFAGNRDGRGRVGWRQRQNRRGANRRMQRLRQQRQRQRRRQKPWRAGRGRGAAGNRWGPIPTPEEYEDMIEEEEERGRRLNRQLKRAKQIELRERRKLQNANKAGRGWNRNKPWNNGRQQNRGNRNRNGLPPLPGMIENEPRPMILPPNLRGAMGRGATAEDIEADYDDSIDMSLTRLRRGKRAANPWRRRQNQFRRNARAHRLRAHVFYDEPYDSPSSASSPPTPSPMSRAFSSIADAFNRLIPGIGQQQHSQSSPYQMTPAATSPFTQPPLQSPATTFFSQFITQPFAAGQTSPAYPPQLSSSVPIRSDPVISLFNQFAPAVTASPFELPTLASPSPPTTPSPKLLAHNTARMIREITSLSDVHRGKNSDFGAVQTLMESFFEAMSSGAPKPLPASDQPLAHLQSRFDGTELGANRPLTNKLFESDMVLTVEQMKAVILGVQDYKAGGLRRRKRKVITGSVYRWPRKPIPYRFKGNDIKWINLIRSALKHWESETCVRWKENGPGKDYVVFFRGSGCYSSVGRTGGSQTISIGYGCEDKGIVTHEVGHSLGFWHEQSRFDRDKYIRLRKEYIIRGTDGNFERRTEQEIETMGLPFDLGSVMMYGPQAFTNDWDHITIETVDRKYQRTIGQRSGPSFIDVKQVNRLYCNDVCQTNLPCQYGGYPDPNQCNTCKCPSGIGGRYCDQLPNTQQCGGELVATNSWQQVDFRGKRKCFWRIKTNNARIRLIFSNIRYRCEMTCHAFIEVKAGSDFQQTGFRICCDDEKEIHLRSDQAEAIFFSDSTILDYEVSFNLRYIQDTGVPITVPPPTSTWVPGVENRGFRGQTNTGGPIEKFILNAIPKIRDARRPLESVASIAAEYGLATLLGIAHQ